MEMVNFQKTNVSKSEFEIPSDYKMVEMPNFNAATADANGPKGPAVNADSVSAAAKNGAKDAAKDAAKQAGIKKLKGIFKH